MSIMTVVAIELFKCFCLMLTLFSPQLSGCGSTILPKDNDSQCQLQVSLKELLAVAIDTHDESIHDSVCNAFVV